ncbi:hypothetical protein MBLNU230_g1037t1 [Neophaeotheca triangularis]
MPPKTRRQAVRGSLSRGFSDATVASVMVDGQLPKDARPRPSPSHLLSSELADDDSNSNNTWSTRADGLRAADDPVELPAFTIDLALPPEQRWLEVCSAMREEIQGITGLFDEVVGGLLPLLPLYWVHRSCAFFLRRIANVEETRELNGISAATGVGLYLLVCLNVLLDLFLGCSSGGVRVQDDNGGTKMVHFRTLDWGMPALRRILVRLDYKYGTDGEILASVITYAGFTGVLTGVRKDLSMSLNFRPNHNNSHQRLTNLQYRWQQAMVVLGFRPSIASRLRENLLTPTLNLSEGEKTLRHQLSRTTYTSITTLMRSANLSTTSCYLILSDGDTTTVLERDRVSAHARSDTDFIIATNGDHDAMIPDPPPSLTSNPTPTTTTTTTNGPTTGPFPRSKTPIQTATLTDILSDAQDRAQCAESNYRRLTAARPKGDSQSERLLQSNRVPRAETTRRPEEAKLQTAQVVDELLLKFPTTNETTHYACVMDPRTGRFAWHGAWMAPVGVRWIRAHLSEGY